MSDLTKRQDVIDVVARQYRYESHRMTALQELPSQKLQLPTTGYELVRQSIFEEADFVSKKLADTPDNQKLLGAWEALTAVMDKAALMDEYNEIRDARYQEEKNGDEI